MPGLTLKLAPNEQVYVNGALLQNGEKRTRLYFLNDAAILKIRDWMDDSLATESVWHRLHISWQRVVAGIETTPQEFTVLSREIRGHLKLSGTEDPFQVLKMLKQKIAEIS